MNQTQTMDIHYEYSEPSVKIIKMSPTCVYSISAINEPYREDDDF